MHDGGEHVWWLRRKAVFTFSVWLNPCWHSTAQGAQVETSNPPSLIKVIKMTSMHEVHRYSSLTKPNYL